MALRMSEGIGGQGNGPTTFGMSHATLAAGGLGKAFRPSTTLKRNASR